MAVPRTFPPRRAAVAWQGLAAGMAASMFPREPGARRRPAEVQSTAEVAVEVEAVEVLVAAAVEPRVIASSTCYS